MTFRISPNAMLSFFKCCLSKIHFLLNIAFSSIPVHCIWCQYMLSFHMEFMFVLTNGGGQANVYLHSLLWSQIQWHSVPLTVWLLGSSSCLLYCVVQVGIHFENKANREDKFIFDKAYILIPAHGYAWLLLWFTTISYF